MRRSKKNLKGAIPSTLGQIILGPQHRPAGRKRPGDPTTTDRFPQGIISVNWPGIRMVIHPGGGPRVHASMEVLFSAGMLPSITVGDPVIQGAGVSGVHGTGVGTPKAAAVADTKAGLVGDMHMPNGKMLIMGLLSMILAAGWLLVIVRFCGNTTSVLIPGGTAHAHFNMAPLQTCMGIRVPPELDDRS